MTTQFANAPIVELIAEVRWHTSNSQAWDDVAPGTPFAFAAPTNEAVERFLSRFVRECNALGYRNSERLIPQNVPYPPGQPVVRLRSDDYPGILVQAGWGTATVNALPPYKSWNEFAPRLNEALGALVAARGDESAPFYGASVRYINAFGPEYMEGTTPGAFARDVLGFDVSLPAAIAEHRDGTEAQQFSLQLAFPTTNGQRARIVLAEGLANNQQALIFDIVLGIADPVEPTAAAVFAVLDGAHTVIHQMFEGTTQGVRDIMRPIEGE